MEAINPKPVSCKCEAFHCKFLEDAIDVSWRSGKTIQHVRKITEKLLPNYSECPLRKALDMPLNK